MTQDKPIVETISNAGEQVTNVFGQFWQLVTSKNTTNNGDSKPIKIEQLPIYAEDNAPLKQKFLPEEPLPLQREFATIRIACEQEYDRVAERFKVVDCAMTQTKKAATKCNAYLTEEWTALPKAAAITVGGMAGFVLGLKRGPVGRLLTTTIGLATMAAFCYPIEAVDVAKTGRAHAEQTWYSFQESPTPSAIVKTNLSPPK
ncbi:MICOS complex subunit MIC27 [Caenorhabditis elegans]|uniref:MICOS complex subunit MIC27 n=1 Tax=Caenorhabditis elegans TaxID=6239 RepID=MOMA1_CAEEL|nr:MICOS complex subunit MIC27 [Caenorhabditis elegans]Q21154.1 RecName: Full=MICOS complex subunit MIC27; AltName: Full=Mitochondrial outer membrane abnormal protein 1; Flags: Precursor [Caenorhabditis elegans]CCD61877.1 MICOS complex subunit MIC27 [Caenorhabditis elegans]|eukprot:NP_497275.1 MICOS complex subunit MIC27 [Caenorhabditis elegans]